MNDWLKGKLSVGISFGYITSTELIGLLDEYSEYIHDVFFSPTESLRLQTRLKIYDFSSTTNEDRLSELDNVIFFCKGKGIRISLVLNASMSSVYYLYELFENYNERYRLDNVTTISSVARYLKEKRINVPIVCSYNEGIKTYDELQSILNTELFDSIVLGNSFIRDFNAFDLIKKQGLTTILLVNNGCSFGCTNFCRVAGGDYCSHLFKRRMEKTGDASILYAEQSLFPEELNMYYKNDPRIDVYKLSSRPITYNEYRDLFDSYVSGYSEPFVRKNPRNYHLYGRLGHFGQYYSSFDYDVIRSEKEKLWSSIKNV